MVKIVLHCSDSAFGNAAVIAKWHLERGWNGIGYHFVILNGWIASGVYNSEFNGHIETGRPLDSDPFLEKSEIGAHVKGYNVDSVGVCLIGKSGQFTDEQMNSALRAVYMLENQFGEIDLFQHSDLDKAKPDCAGIDVGIFNKNYKIYKSLSEEYQSHNN